MSDADLRALEREILHEPADLDLRRRHARALQRAGDEERAVGALDLAWRLGAEELWDELRAALDARLLLVRGVAMCYVPGGPFAMGADDKDDDAKPMHLVHLSPFYVARQPLSWAPLVGWEQQDRHWQLTRSHERHLAMVAALTHDEAVAAVGYLGRAATLEGAPRGRWSLISEAQWERVARAGYGRPDGANPYGVMLDPRRPDWTLDAYDPDAYRDGARRDPLAVGDAAALRVVRGVPGLPPPLQATYREAARPDGSFEVGGWLRGRVVRHEESLVVRPVLAPGLAPDLPAGGRAGGRAGGPAGGPAGGVARA